MKKSAKNYRSKDGKYVPKSERVPDSKYQSKSAQSLKRNEKKPKADNKSSQKKT